MAMAKQQQFHSEQQLQQQLLQAQTKRRPGGGLGVSFSAGSVGHSVSGEGSGGLGSPLQNAGALVLRPNSSKFPDAQAQQQQQQQRRLL
jgi:hypothetical protein